MKPPSSADQRQDVGRQVSFPLNGKRAPSYTDWMKTVYAHREYAVEPVIGNIGTNKRLNRFSLREKTKVQGQWKLFCLVYNIEKPAKYGYLSQ